MTKSLLVAKVLARRFRRWLFLLRRDLHATWIVIRVVAVCFWELFLPHPIRWWREVKKEAEGLQEATS